MTPEIECPDCISNKTYDEIQIGESVSLVKSLTFEDINLFALASGDINPTHIDHDFVQTSSYRKITGHAMWSGALFSRLLGTNLPGPGTVYRGQVLKFHRPMCLSDQIKVTITAIGKDPEDHVITFDCRCVNALDERDLICTGTAEVYAPLDKIKRERVTLPHLKLNDRGGQLQRLVAMTKTYPPIRMAVVHPVDRNSLMGAIEAARSNLIIPVLVGPREKIKLIADQEGVNLDDYEVLDVEHSHAAAERSVAMARAGEVAAIMKGSLHTDELMGAVIQRGTGITTSRRMSHVFLMDVPAYPRPLMVTDAAINIDPSLEEKRDIVQNAIDLAHALGIPLPKVALLSAVETVNPKMRSTLEAAAICKMADRKQITGGLVDGPLAFDNAVSEEAARIKGIDSPVAGRADILVAPDLEAGNMVAKQLEYMADALSSGIVLGARVPIALTSRADSILSRMASCALALLLAHNKEKKVP